MTRKKREWFGALAGLGVGLLFALIMFLIIVPLLLTGHPPYWTGFGTDPDYGTAIHVSSVPPVRTLWDWLGLVVIPAALALFGLWLNRRDKALEYRQRKREALRERRRQRLEEQREQAALQLENERERNYRQAAEKREESYRKTQLRIEQERQREAELTSYMDRITEMLNAKSMIPSGPMLPYSTIEFPSLPNAPSPENDRVLAIARIRTLTVLTRLDSKRKATVIKFLFEAGLLQEIGTLIKLADADLSKVPLYLLFLPNISLVSVNLQGANFYRSNMQYARLVSSELTETNFANTNLSDANLRNARFSGADLTEANLTNTKLDGAWFAETKFVEEVISEDTDEIIDAFTRRIPPANLSKANLTKADLTGANLTGADLRGTNLTMTKITVEQLLSAKTFEGSYCDVPKREVVEPKDTVPTVKVATRSKPPSRRSSSPKPSPS
jgi:uncharacterized protein YjbI with pentapeptide repeats